MLFTLLSVCSKLFTVCVRRFLKYRCRHSLISLILKATYYHKYRFVNNQNQTEAVGNGPAPWLLLTNKTSGQNSVMKCNSLIIETSRYIRQCHNLRPQTRQYQNSNQRPDHIRFIGQRPPNRVTKKKRDKNMHGQTNRIHSKNNKLRRNK